MKLRSLQVTNFRCFESLTVEFDPQLTVLVANNGMGKTAVLEAIATGLGSFFSPLPNIPGRNPKETDFRIGEDGKKIRVVSMPSTNVFDAQDAAYRESVLPAAVTKRVVVEAGVTDSWWKYAGTAGKVIGLDRFGESAPAPALFKEFGFTPENVAAVVESIL